MATKIKQTLKEKVSQIVNHKDAASFCKSISIDHMKTMLVQYIDDNKNVELLRKIELKTRPIDDIFPECIVGSCILHFLLYEVNILLVNKQFNKLAHENVYNHLRTRIKIMEVCFFGDILYNEIII